jgi:hypothetical protein
MNAGDIKSSLIEVQTALEEIVVLRQQIQGLMNQVGQKFQFCLAEVTRIIEEMPPQS